MKDTDVEPLTPPNTGPLSKDEMRPFIASTADEIVPFATSLIVDGESVEIAFRRLIEIGQGACGEATLLARSGQRDTATLRAAIYRYTAAGVALLALDERVRGEEVVAREMVQLDERGFFTKRSG